jgi:hypothetical protein
MFKEKQLNSVDVEFASIEHIYIIVMVTGLSNEIGYS